MYFPINVDIREKKCLIVGGGKVALRKVRSLIHAEADVCVVAPECQPEILTLAKEKKICLTQRYFQESDITTDFFLVIGATNDWVVQKKIYECALKAKVLVNIVDVPQWCGFTIPSKIEQGKLMLTVSTQGASPALSRQIREKWSKEFGAEYALFLDWMAEARQLCKEKLRNEAERKQIFETLVQSDVLNLLSQGKEREARKEFEKLLVTSVPAKQFQV